MAAYGSLAAALHVVAADQGMSLTMVVTPSDPLRHATISSVLPHRETLFVSAWHFEPRWRIQGSANNGILISGTTPDLRQLPAVVLGWAEGAALDDIAQAAPFDILTGRFEVPDGNPADVIASEWQWLLKDAKESGWPEYEALIKAAHAEPKLRKLYPYTSHWALSFSATPYPFTPSFATLLASQGGAYTVKEWWNGPPLAQVATPAEAISMATDRLPEHLASASRTERNND
ncbi:hypothetical protein JMF97_29475 [Micromonospora fiedleri]|uniref:Uncharacterized protein n=1 Tax=Micromonospora fiedleri TaxID=1157498 RepID=A0ABS1UWT8_9ACTN|nr:MULTISPECIES: DUF6193 family natural product biosynthesis protein [Micromonospora]MBL6280299.1 hypothetical protein [Micromonospora fiedleri]